MALTVTICGAKDLKSQDWMSKNDPFCVTTIVRQTDAGRAPAQVAIEREKTRMNDNGGAACTTAAGAWRTRTLDNAGSACTWNESKVFAMQPSELGWKCLQVVCWDDDGGDDADCIGYSHIPLGAVINGGSKRDWYILKGMGRGTPHGLVEVEVSFVPASAPAPAPAPQPAFAPPPAATATAPPPGFPAAAPPPGFPAAAPPPGFSAPSAAAAAPPSVPVAQGVIVNPRDIVIAAKSPTAGGAAIPLEMCECLELGLAWDLVPGRPRVDLDAACVLFDYSGKFVDAVFYNNLMGAGGAVTHSGDDRTGEGGGDDERISLRVPMLPKQIEYAVFVVSAHAAGASFADVAGCRAELRDSSGAEHGKRPHTLCSTTCDMSGGKGRDCGSLILAVFYRDLDLYEWHLKEVGRPCAGHNFQECGGAIAKELSMIMPDDLSDEITMDGAHTYSMKKGDDVRLPPGCNVLTIGLGWESPGGLDLDAAVLVLRDVDGDGVQDVTHVVNYKNLKEDFRGCAGSTGRVAIAHMGDNTTGRGHGDDETIHVFLDLLVSTHQYRRCH